MTLTSEREMGQASRMSRPFPCGIPSRMSIITTSASSASAMRWAAVAPTLPAPTTVSLNLPMFDVSLFSCPRPSSGRSLPALFARGGRALRARCSPQGLHILDHRGRELRRLQKRRALHQPMEVVGHPLLADGLLEARLDEDRD